MTTIKIVMPEARYFVEAFDIRLPDGRSLEGLLYRSRSRRTGRRIIVKEAGHVVYDGDECYDLGNATNGLERWLDSIIARTNHATDCETPAAHAGAGD